MDSPIYLEYCTWIAWPFPMSELLHMMKADIALEEDCLMARTRKIDKIDSGGLVSGFNLVLHTHTKRFVWLLIVVSNYFVLHRINLGVPSLHLNEINWTWTPHRVT